MSEKQKTLGQVAFEAARDVTGCDMDWDQANQVKWEAAAKAVIDEANKRLDKFEDQEW